MFKPSLAHTIQVPELDTFKARGYSPLPHTCIELRIITALIAHLELAGFELHSVYDGEIHTRVKTAKEALELIFNLDEVSLRINKVGHRRDVHGILLVLGNGEDVLSDWNYFDGDRDGFSAAMDAFEPERYI